MQAFPENELRQKALATLEANCVETSRGVFLAAGGHQFRTLWVRDFCHSVPGILQAGWHDLAERQLRLILSFLRPDGYLPRGIDAVNPKWRVLWNTALRFLPDPFRHSYRGALRPEYLGEHGTPAYDSNLLFLLAWDALARASSAPQDKWAGIADRVPLLLSPYAGHRGKGGLHQPAFSDWQDSARREGSVLLTHLLLARVCSALEQVDLLPKPFASFREPLGALLEERRDGALFRETERPKFFALDAHLHLLEDPCFGPWVDKQETFRMLRSHPLWCGESVPGVPVWPFYLSSEVSWSVKAVGLRHYHDHFLWGWLTAEAAKVAAKMGDGAEARRIGTAYAEISGREKFLTEIHEAKNGGWRPVIRPLYRAESPFSWTAAKWVEALAAIHAADVK